LDPNKSSVEIEDQVVSLVAHGFRYADPELDGCVDDRRLRQDASLIGREVHALDRTGGLGGALSGLDSRF
jgi:hypothetical protein